MTDTDGSSEYQKKIADLESEVRRLEKVQSDLAESEEKYRLLVEHANDAIFIIQDGQVQFPNNKGREIGRQLGLDLERVPFIEYVHPDDREMVIDRHLRRLRGEDLPHTYSLRLVGSSGREMTMALNAVLIQWQSRPATLNFMRDITAQKELEAQLEQAQKLEALGSMAGGMAHDFNNLLMSIRADAASLQLGTDISDRQQGTLSGILHAVSSGEAMTKQLLGFARKDTCKFFTTDLNRLSEKTIDLFKRNHPGLNIHTDLDNQLWMVEADPVQLERVILNLMVNSDQAMPDGGNLYLSTRNETLDRRSARRLGLTSGQYIRVSVADDGPGMGSDTLKRVFEPFFTTKRKGQGTGLGLAGSFGIVQSHHGALTASSEKGAGACFDIYLPVSTNDACTETETAAADQQAVCLPPELDWLHTVLLVDDNRLVVTAVTLMLEKQGLRVLNALSAQSAFTLLEARADEIDLIILDMILPKMSGTEALHRMRELNPAARFMLTSGCGADDAVCKLIENHRVGFIQKPYSEKELYRKIRELSF